MYPIGPRGYPAGSGPDKKTLPMSATDDNRKEWEDSYRNRDNYLFYPNEEVVRFFAKYVRKRIGREEFRVVADVGRILCLGCGIGRHVFFCDDMQCEAWGVDLAFAALSEARESARHIRRPALGDRFIQCSGDALPFADGEFGAAISHGVLDSMEFSLARRVAAEAHRVLRPGGVFYLDLISGDNDAHAREFAGQVVVETRHEHGTIQSYFNYSKIRELIGTTGFEIEECVLVQRQEVTRGGRVGRYHIVLRR